MAASTSTKTFYISPEESATTSRNSISSSSSDDLDDLTTLPFPQPLPRHAFVSPDFSPATFLSTLTSNRFQTLEDLRAELTTLSRTIETELFELVNDNYTDFLDLGNALKGGEGRVEEVRVGVLGFERELQGLRKRVDGERGRVREVLGQKRVVGREIAVGRGLLEVDRGLDELEGALGLKRGDGVGGAVLPAHDKQAAEVDEENEEDEEGAGKGVEWSSAWDDDLDDDDLDDDDDEAEEGAIPPRLQSKIDKFLAIRVLCERFGREHPFIAAQQSRIRKIKETLLVDMDAAIRAETSVKGKQAIMRWRSEVQE
jgi:conserved oligomeric Golgi complex subunit 2